jgi:hypothetical protein
MKPLTASGNYDSEWKLFFRNKSDVAGLTIIHLNQIENQVGTKIRVIVTDNGTEFKNQRMKKYCEDKGIKHIFTVPYSSIQNGKVERTHRVDSETAICLLQDSGLPMTLWTYAMKFGCYCRNRALSRSSRSTKTPLELLTGQKPRFHSLAFGQEVYIQTQNRKLGKLDRKAQVGRFLGFPENSKGIWVYVNGRVEVCRTWIVKVAEDSNLVAKGQNHDSKSRQRARKSQNKSPKRVHFQSESSSSEEEGVSFVSLGNMQRDKDSPSNAITPKSNQSTITSVLKQQESEVDSLGDKDTRSNAEDNDQQREEVTHLSGELLEESNVANAEDGGDGNDPDESMYYTDDVQLDSE